MTRVRWSSLSAAVAVGVVAGFAIGVAIGVAVGRGAAPAAGPAAEDVTLSERPTPGGADGVPTLSGSAGPSPTDAVLHLDLSRGGVVVWATLDAMVVAARVDEVIATALAIARRDATPKVLEALGEHVNLLKDPASRLRVHDALRAAGFRLPLTEAAELELRTLAGRADEVVATTLDALSKAEPASFPPLLAAAMKRGVDGDALRAQAERDAWPAWKWARVAAAFAAAAHPGADAWQGQAARAGVAEEREADRRRAARNADRVTEAREAVADQPENAVAWAELGDVLRDAGGDAVGAADAYERALDLDPFAVPAAEGLAAIAPERLLPRIRERWRELPDDERLMILATTLLRTGHADEATTAFFRCRELDSAWLLAGLASLAPGPALASIDTRLPLGDDEALRLARVDALAALGRVPEAREALAPLVTPDSGFAADTWERLLALDPDRAIADHGSERAALPPNAEFRVFLGEAFRRVGRGAEAKELVGPFLAGNPDWIGWEFVAPLLAALDPETRLAPLEARARDPDEQDDARPWAILAEAYALLGRTADARRAYDEAIAREPDATMTLRIRRLRLR